MTEDDAGIWRALGEAEQASRARDLADLRSGRRTAAEINAANRIVPEGGHLAWPEDLADLDLALDPAPPLE